MNISLLVMILVSLNVNGIHNDEKWSNILNTVLAVNPQIVALQETHLMVDQQYLFSRALPGYSVFYENGTSNSAGVLTAIKRNCGIEVLKTYKHSGCFVSLTCLWNLEEYQVINVYAPNDLMGRKDFLANLYSDLSDENIILCSDFNSVLNANDRISQKEDETTHDLNMLIRTANLVKLEGHKQFTYHHSTLSKRKSRIDLFLLSRSIASNWVCGYRFCIFSNHQVIQLFPV